MPSTKGAVLQDLMNFILIGKASQDNDGYVYVALLCRSKHFQTAPPLWQTHVADDAVKWRPSFWNSLLCVLSAIAWKSSLSKPSADWPSWRGCCQFAAIAGKYAMARDNGKVWRPM